MSDGSADWIQRDIAKKYGLDYNKVWVSFRLDGASDIIHEVRYNGKPFAIARWAGGRNSMRILAKGEAQTRQYLDTHRTNVDRQRAARKQREREKAEQKRQAKMAKIKAEVDAKSKKAVADFRQRQEEIRTRPPDVQQYRTPSVEAGETPLPIENTMQPLNPGDQRVVDERRRTGELPEQTAVQQPQQPVGAPQQPVGTPQAPPAQTQDRFHNIVSGDNLSTLAARYGTTVQELMRLNPNIRDPNLIRAGERLRLPGAGGQPQVPGKPQQPGGLQPTGVQPPEIENTMQPLNPEDRERVERLRRQGMIPRQSTFSYTPQPEADPVDTPPPNDVSGLTLNPEDIQQREPTQLPGREMPDAPDQFSYEQPVDPPTVQRDNRLDAYIQQMRDDLSSAQQNLNNLYGRRSIEENGLTELIPVRPDITEVIKKGQELSPINRVTINPEKVKEQSDLEPNERNVGEAVGEETTDDEQETYENYVSGERTSFQAKFKEMPVSHFGNEHIRQTYGEVLDLYDELYKLKDAAKDVRKYVKDAGKGELSYTLLSALTLRKKMEVNGEIDRLQHQIDLTQRILTIQNGLQDRQDRLTKEQREYDWRAAMEQQRQFEVDREFQFRQEQVEQQEFERERAFQTSRVDRARDNLFRALGMERDIEVQDRDFNLRKDQDRWQRAFTEYKQRRGEFEADRENTLRQQQLDLQKAKMDLDRNDPLALARHNLEVQRLQEQMRQFGITSELKRRELGIREGALNKQGKTPANNVRGVVSSLGAAGVRDTLLARVFSTDTDWDEVQRLGSMYGVEVPDDPARGPLNFKGDRQETLTRILNDVANRIFSTVSGSDSEATKFLQVFSTFFTDADGNPLPPSELVKHLFVQS